MGEGGVRAVCSMWRGTRLGETVFLSKQLNPVHLSSAIETEA